MKHPVVLLEVSYLHLVVVKSDYGFQKEDQDRQKLMVRIIVETSNHSILFVFFFFFDQLNQKHSVLNNFTKIVPRVITMTHEKNNHEDLRKSAELLVSICNKSLLYFHWFIS